MAWGETEPKITPIIVTNIVKPIRIYETSVITYMVSILSHKFESVSQYPVLHL